MKYLYAIAAAAILYLLAVDNQAPTPQQEAEDVAADVVDAQANSKRHLSPRVAR